MIGLAIAKKSGYEVKFDTGELGNSTKFFEKINNEINTEFIFES